MVAFLTINQNKDGIKVKKYLKNEDRIIVKRYCRRCSEYKDWRKKSDWYYNDCKIEQGRSVKTINKWNNDADKRFIEYYSNLVSF